MSQLRPYFLANSGIHGYHSQNSYAPVLPTRKLREDRLLAQRTDTPKIFFVKWESWSEERGESWSQELSGVRSCQESGAVRSQGSQELSGVRSCQESGAVRSQRVKSSDFDFVLRVVFVGTFVGTDITF
eukprot:scaffold185883_cov33-Cyclotella_meneghiniana.AAC.1